MGLIGMRIQIICSTMFGNPPLFLQRDYHVGDYLVVNQCKERAHEVNDFINCYETGLSKSRNKALTHSDRDICIISDNDVFYSKDYIEIISKAFERYPDADAITFQVQTPEGEMYKKYSDSFFWHNKLSLAKVSSIEIAFRRKSVLEKNIKFDERFGLGSKFPTSEEYIFLSDCLSKGLKIAYVPGIIVFHPKESSGGDFSNDNLVKAKGAMIHRVFGDKGILICLLFSIRKYKYSGKSFFNFCKIIFSGFFKHRKDI